MTTMTIDCAPELAVALGRRETELESEVMLASALKLFELGRIPHAESECCLGLRPVEAAGSVAGGQARTRRCIPEFFWER